MPQPEYEYRCIGSITCDPMLDEHGRACERVNDEARAEFYEHIARVSTYRAAADLYADAVETMIDEALS